MSFFTNRMKKITTLFIMLVFVPFITYGSTQTELYAQLQALLAQVAQLQAQLNVVEGGSGTTTSSSNTTVACPALSRTLSLGDSGTDVSALQQFLAADKAIYPEGIVSGYFGSLTQVAVQRWQSVHGVVSSGSAATTGFGLVGPKTRTAISSACGSSGTVSKTQNLIITPTIGQYPLGVTATFSLATPCTPFTLNWGDGSTPITQTAASDAICAQVITYKRATHTYQKAGIHTASLNVNGTIETVSVSVGAPTAIAKPALYPTEGTVPFTTSVTFPVSGSSCTSYYISWGDGDSNEYEPSQFDTCTTDSGTQAVSHTYEVGGDYVIALKTGHAPIDELPISAQWNAIVHGASTNALSFNISPVSGTAPLTVNVSLESDTDACASYEVNWGDGSTPKRLQGIEGDECFISSEHFSHVYTSAGTYIATIKLGEGLLEDLVANVQYITVQ